MPGFSWPRKTAKLIFATLILAAALSTDRPATAQEAFPNKPIRLIIPFPPGGTSDIIARVFTQHMAERLGQQIIIDNRPGASTLIGSRAVANSEPDGYTLLLATPSYHTYAKLFKPVAMFALTPYFLTVTAGLPANNVSELIAYIKSGKAGEPLRYGSSGVGGSPHLAGVQFDLLSGTKSVHVPYKGTAEAAIALVRSDIQMIYVGLPTTQELVESGKLRLLAAAGSQRSIFRPDLPTLQEQGLKGFEASAWYSVVAPAATPDDRADKIANVINAIAAMPDVQETMKKAGGEMQIMTRPEFTKFLQADYERWKKVMELAGLETEPKEK
jgi:tripartite-type tricarboxylate transporter receptor subunit TctC